MARLLVAMSGGVDSSVAAARLVAAGHEVIGVTLHLWDYPDDDQIVGRCCAPEDVYDAARVAAQLGIAHYAFDRRSEFLERIVNPFVDAYLAGSTPSPCVECNRQIKLAELLAIAERLGAEGVATGHYARLTQRHGILTLARGNDARKDQSYFLYSLTPSALSRLVFPLGEDSKEVVRAEALALGLCGADKGESQELCFVPTGRYDAFIEQRAPERVRPGKILDESGREVATHAGVHRFTLGQRRNLGVAVGQRAYVVGIEPETATVQLGAKSLLSTACARIDAPVFHHQIAEGQWVDCVVRYRGAPQRATVSTRSGATWVTFETSAAVVVPGQHAVFYDDTQVLGGGRIAEIRSQAAAAHD